MWSRLLGLLGPGAFGKLTMLLGLIISVSAAGAWLREDAKNDCNQEWELKIAKGNEKLTLELAAKRLRIEDLEQRLIQAANIIDATRSENVSLLEKQREATPQSQSCLACRIPSDRVWLRSDTRSRKGSGS